MTPVEGGVATCASLAVVVEYYSPIYPRFSVLRRLLVHIQPERHGRISVFCLLKEHVDTYLSVVKRERPGKRFCPSVSGRHAVEMRETYRFLGKYSRK